MDRPAPSPWRADSMPRNRGRIAGFYALGLLAAMALFNAADQTVLAAVAANLEAELHIGDAEIGLLASAFVVATALAGMPLGYWADRGSRRTIIALGVGLWSLAGMLTGLGRNLVQVAAARVVVGIGEASYFPAGGSLIGDYFTKHGRGRAMAAIYAAFTVGLAAGVIGGGVIGLRFGWRWAFILAGAPGVLLAALALTIREPLRGAAEERGPRLRVARDATARSILGLLRIPTYTLAVAATMLALFGGAGVFQFVPLYIHRRFGLDIAQAGALLGMPLLVGGLLGTPVGGWLVDWRSKRSASAPAEITTVGLLACVGFAVLTFSATSVPTFAAAMVAMMFCVGIVQPVAFTVNQNVVAPSLRGSAASVSLTLGKVGNALGPLAVGIVSSQVRDLGSTFLVLTPTAWLLAAGCAALAVKGMQRY